MVSISFFLRVMASISDASCLPNNKNRPAKHSHIDHKLHTEQLRHSQRTHTHTSMNTCTQTLSLWASSKTESANLQDWQSHHRHLAVDGNIAYHWICNAVKSQNIRSHGESNPGPQVLPRHLHWLQTCMRAINFQAGGGGRWWEGILVSLYV